MNPIRFVPLVLSLAALPAQTTTVFPAEYTAVAEGPLNSPNFPFANGTSRVLVVYDRLDLDIPVGATVTQLGFRQDATLTAMDMGRSLQLEVRVGYTTNAASAPVTNFDANYDGAPTTVFGPATFVLPNLRDAQNPLANGRFFVDLTTPFVYAPGTRNLVVEYRVFGNSGGGTSFNYRLDRADFFSPVVNGAAGCQHSGGGVPTLTASPVRVGATLNLTGASGPANSVALLLISIGNRLAPAFPLDLVFPGASPACTGQLMPGSLSTLLAVTGTTGGSTFSYPIPNQAVLNDLWLSHQLLLLDPFAPGGVSISNGTEVQIGIKPRTTIVAAQGPPATVTTGTLQANYCPVAFFTWQ